MDVLETAGDVGDVFSLKYSSSSHGVTRLYYRVIVLPDQEVGIFPAKIHYRDCITIQGERE